MIHNIYLRSKYYSSFAIADYLNTVLTPESKLNNTIDRDNSKIIEIEELSESEAEALLLEEIDFSRSSYN